MLKTFGIVGIPKRGFGPLTKPPPNAILDEQHPLAQGLISGWVFSSLRTSCYVSKASLIVKGNVSITSHGLKAGNYLNEVYSSQITSDQINHTRFCYVVTGPSWGAGLERVFSDSEGMGIYTTDTTYNCYGGSDVLVISPTITIGQVHSVGYTHTNSPASRTYGFWDGNNASSATNMGTIWGSATDYFGYDNITNFKAWRGHIICAMKWSRVLKVEEFSQLHYAPYQFFWTPKKKIFIPLLADNIRRGNPVRIRPYNPTIITDSVGSLRTFGIVGLPKKGMSGPLVKPPPNAIIDEQHPLTQKIAGCWLMDGQTKNIVDKSNITGTATLTGNYSRIAIYGSKGISLDGSTAAAFTDDDNLHSTYNGLTFLVRAVPRSNQVNQYIFSKGAAANTAETVWGVYTQTGDLMRYRWCDNTPALKTITSIRTFSVGNVYDLASTWDGSQIKAYWNGTTESSPVAMTSIASRSKITYLGATQGSPLTGHFVGFIDYGMVWSRALSALEISQLHYAPYQFFWTPKKRIIFNQMVTAGSAIKEPIIIKPYNPIVITDSVSSINTFGIVGLPKKGMGGPLTKPPPNAIIDKQHPLAQRINAAWLFNGSTGKCLDSVSGIPAIPQGSAAFGYTNKESGLLCNSVGSAAAVVTSQSKPNINKNPFSVSFRVSNNNILGLYAYVHQFDAFLIDGAATSFGYIRFAITSGQITTTKTISSGKPNSVSCIYTGQSVNVFINNLNKESSATSGPNATSTDDLWIGRHATATTRYLVGSIHHLYLYSRAISDGEVEQLHYSPYQFFWIPKKKIIFNQLAEAGSTIKSSVIIRG